MDAYACWADRIYGVGHTTLFQLRDQMAEQELTGTEPEPTGSKNSFPFLLYSMDETSLLFTVKAALGDRAADRVYDRILDARKKDPKRYPEEYAGGNITFLSAFVENDEGEEMFPERLRGIPDEPSGIYYLGRLPGNGPICAIIGSRMATSYGINEAEEFARELSVNGVQIVSGMARGIDGIAERTTIISGGMSFAVLGSGVDVCYPPQNRELYEMTLKRGGVISEYPPGTQARAQLFPQRNRIISGLSDVVLIIEAKEKSGTLITADMALNQGKDIFAVPGRITDRTSRGCNNLIRQGCFPATSVDDVLEFLYSDEAESIRKKRGTYKVHAERIRSGNALSAANDLSSRKRIIEKSAETKLKNEKIARLRDTDRMLYGLLDESTPYCTDVLYKMLKQEAKEYVSVSDMMRGLTNLLIRGLAREIRTGYYLKI